MRLVIALLVVAIAAGCRDDSDYRWEGLPGTRRQAVCSFQPTRDRGGTCMSGGFAFACVVDDDALKVLCQKLVFGCGIPLGERP